MAYSTGDLNRVYGSNLYGDVMAEPNFQAEIVKLLLKLDNRIAEVQRELMALKAVAPNPPPRPN
jgi:hypothetical protein